MPTSTVELSGYKTMTDEGTPTDGVEAEPGETEEAVQILDVDDDASSEEIRERIIERVEDAEGAIVVTGSLTDEDGDGENDAMIGNSAMFIEDGLDEDDRRHLAMSLHESTLEVIMPDGAKAIPLPMGGMGGGGGDDIAAGLLGALIDLGGGSPFGDDGPDRDEDDDEDDEYGSMFA